MRQREARVVVQERYQLPSSTLVDVAAIDTDKAIVMCRYASHVQAPWGERAPAIDVTLSVRFMEKFARRVWA